MTQTNVLPLRQNTKPQTRKTRRVSTAALFRRHAPAIGLGSVIIVLLGLSLSHLSAGVQLVTGCTPIEALAMSVGLDLLIVSLEVAMVSTAGTKAYKPVARFANPALIAAFTWSAGLNALAFSADTSVLWMTIVAASLGASIPALIYAGTRAWAALAISTRTA
jgi:hypothetical protein